jgi:hypothetical protein
MNPKNSHKEAQKAQEKHQPICASCASLWLLKPNNYFKQDCRIFQDYHD